MKCFECKSEIENEYESIHIGDGDFVCSQNCESKYEEGKEEFFKNVGNDNWYQKWMSDQI